MNKEKYQLYAIENKSNDEVLLMNGFTHINQLIPYFNRLRVENQKYKEVIDKAIKHIEDVVFYQSPNEFVKVLIEILANKEVE